MVKPRELFTSRWGFVLTAMGAAVGTGNIWRFPREAAANGGGAFMIAWLLFLFSWSIPLLIAEFAIGKRTRLGTVGTFKEFVGKKYAWMGAWMVLVSAAINFYYAVVMGWVIRYFVVSAGGGLHEGVDTLQLWHSFISSPLEVVFFQVVALGIGAFVVYRGIAKGIEKTNVVLMPALFILLIFAAIWALTLPGAINGLKFLYIPKVEYLLRAETWIRALSQSAWSCSAGMGMAITYAVYIKRKEDTALNAFITGLGNNSVSLIAGIAVICTVFAMSATTTDALDAVEAGSTGLTFIHLTNLFSTMPAGTLLAAIFFLAMAFAALTSLISGMEIAVRNFMDHGWSRHKSLTVVALGTFLLGVPSAVIILTVNGEPVPAFLDNQDHVWGLGLIVSGLFVAFAVYKYGVSRFRERLINTPWNDLYIGRWWEYVIIILFPVQFFTLIAWYFYQTSTGNPETWWVSGPGGIALLLFQWVLALIILMALNDKIAKAITAKGEMEKSDDVYVKEQFGR